MKKLQQEIREELTNNIIPFWSNLKDEENGGFFGECDFNLNINKTASKGVILNSRILWFFSKAYLELKDNALLENATHAYNFLINSCLDKKYGGVYWSVDYKGNPQETIKHTYNQAFAIYALSAYFEASKDEKALDLAFNLVDLIENKCKDNNGYLESFSREFAPMDNEKLSENGVIASRTMNTLLHVFEAYSGLYTVTRSKEVEKSMRFMLNIFKNKIYNPALQRQEVFFDLEYNSLLNLHSYGHDIESAWLIEWGTSLLNDKDLLEEISQIGTALANNVYQKAYRDNSIYNENEHGKDDVTRVWWVQAEAIVGFINEWQKNSQDETYKQVALDIWEFIKEYIVDKREHSEWFWDVDANFKPSSKKDIVEPWKCPYHNGRMCLEILNRID
ncbi:N-acylglucosamine 2-epimerase [Candidatus Epulonipiscium fishelsonii]|uniref:N-acylglucosamine 2-epimerase n=1 Tax=Candidatus Epulonipiscium fishelsonii TaxID=77094 RepID=A0ACC8XA36_9FIRM|nr:N-acylglucosamine 2-epimerase [Epulopiscium sp. SCG-B05WGA-EpuloA1]ONI39046.1 N-acylglucosamine 2-epimerase [Epulopiscium sp. SCG-B11WGA-EpuloA1]